MVKIWIKSLKINENILNTILHKLVVMRDFTTICKEQIYKSSIDFAKGSLIT